MVAVLVVASSIAGDNGQARRDAEAPMPVRKRDETPFGPPFDSIISHCQTAKSLCERLENAISRVRPLVRHPAVAPNAPFAPIIPTRPLHSSLGSACQVPLTQLADTGALVGL